MKKLFVFAFALSITAIGVDAQQTKPCCKKQETEQKDCCKKGAKKTDKKTCCDKNGKTVNNK